MKLKSWPAHAPLPTLCSLVLLYGPDQGLIGERGLACASQATPDLNDPFNVALLTMTDLHAQPHKFWDEVSATSLMGGNRLIWIKDADDTLANSVQEYLDNPNPTCFIVLESGDLSPKSALRAITEKNDKSLAVACYVEDEKDLVREIGKWLQAEGYSITPDALQTLSVTVRGDRAIARREIEKLITYAGENKKIDNAAIFAVSADTRAETRDALTLATASGDVAKAFAAWHSLIADGTGAIAVLRGLQAHFRRLQQARISMDYDDLSAAQAIDRLQPKVFYKNVDPMVAQLRRWKYTEIETVINAIEHTESMCKKTGYVPETITGWLLLAIATRNFDLDHAKSA